MNSSNMQQIDRNIEMTIEKQADRFLTFYNEETGSEKAISWAKEIVAKMYQFEHWHFLSHHLRNSIYKSDDQRFDYVELHPSTISNISPSVLEHLKLQKHILHEQLEEETTKELSMTLSSSDIGDILIAKMYGFNTIVDIFASTKYHFFDCKVSLFDERSNHLVITDKTGGYGLESLKELLICHQDFGPVMAIAPREFFETEIRHRDIIPFVGLKSISPFYNWKMSRLYNLFQGKLKELNGDNIQIEKAYRMAEISSSLFVCTSARFEIKDYMRFLDAREFCKVPYSASIPESIKNLSLEFLSKLPGYEKGDGFYYPLKPKTSRAFNNIAMMLSHTLVHLREYFEWIEDTDESMLSFIDSESIQHASTSKVSLNNGIDIEQMIEYGFEISNPKSMLFIKCDSNDIDMDVMLKIDELSKKKNAIICWWCGEKIPKQLIGMKANKMSIKEKSGKYRYKLTLHSGLQHTWMREY